MAAPPGMLSIDRITHRAALIGRVVDKLDQRVLSQATVEIIDAPVAYKSRLAALRQGRPGASPDRIVTDGNGAFRWLDLPAGDYTLRSSLSDPRYAAATVTASVTADKPASAELALAPTAVIGTISADRPAGPLAMVRVRMLDSGEVTFTAADGRFTLSPVEPGAARVLELSAQGYVTATRTVTLPQGQTTTLPAITLLHS
ncbi:MAG TPA: carboxypeptidase regulatory-like domain-containing protein [Kofleriaceae bacterium]